jgi:hypothetical protein
LKPKKVRVREGSRTEEANRKIQGEGREKEHLIVRRFPGNALCPCDQGRTRMETIWW